MKEINVAVTGGAGQIAYSLLPRLVSGETFGKGVKVNLRLIEIPQVVEKLEGTIMELIDCGFDETGNLLATADIEEGVKDADWVLLVGSIPRGIVIDGKKIEERSDLLRINGGIFTDQGEAIGRLAKSDCKILVVGNPANTNALIGMTKAQNTGQQWFAMTAFINAHSVTQPVDNDFMYVNPAGGFGMRFKFNKKSRTALAVDFGWGKDESHGMYFRFTDAF